MKKLQVIVNEMTPSAIKRTEWREDNGVLKGYRTVRHAGAVRLVPCVDESGKQWEKPKRGAQPGNRNNYKGEEGLTSRIIIRCTPTDKAACVKSAHPGDLSPWARDILLNATKKS